MPVTHLFSPNLLHRAKQSQVAWLMNVTRVWMKGVEYDIIVSTELGSPQGYVGRVSIHEKQHRVLDLFLFNASAEHDQEIIEEFACHPARVGCSI